MNQPDRIEAMALKFREVLAATERLKPDELRAYQENLLVPLLHHARRHVPFYRDQLAPVFKGDDLDLSRLGALPILTREQAQQNTKALSARDLPPHVGPVGAEETSGSTGRPFRHLKNQLVDVAGLGLTDRMYRWWDCDGDKTMATFLSRRRETAPPPEGSTLRGWRIGFDGLHHLIDMWADTDVQIDWLLKRRPHYLTAYSSTLLALAERVRKRGVDLRFERIFSVATMLSDEIRQACRAVLGASPIDQYGAQEVSFIACECPTCGLYHVSAEVALVEILREDGTPCAPRE